MLILPWGLPKLFLKGLHEVREVFIASDFIQIYGPMLSGLEQLGYMPKAGIPEPGNGGGMVEVGECPLEGRNTHMCQESQFLQRQLIQFIMFCDISDSDGRSISMMQQPFEEARPMLMGEV